MNIDEMSEQEKSVMLAKLCGWPIMQESPGTDYSNWMWQVLLPPDYKHHGAWSVLPNLYDPANMALLAKAIEWACENLESIFDMGPIGYFMHYFNPKDFHGSMCRMVDEILRQGVSAEMIERP